MKKQKRNMALLAAAGVTLVSTGHTQTVDALLDKLVDKGVLSVREANELREESDKGFNTAISAKLGMPDWVTSLKMNGDVRGRYEHFCSPNDGFTTRERFRYRLRFGIVANMLDNFEVGFRLTSGEANGSFGGDPISGNTTFTDNGSKKLIYIDQAYGKWTALNGPSVVSSFIVGKMENPFVFSDLVFDSDYTPEGVASQTTWTINDVHALRLNVGVFALDELSGEGDDPYLLGSQIRWDAKWNVKMQTSVGAAWLGIASDDRLANGAVPNVNRGNTRNAAGAPVADFSPFVLDAAITYSLDSAPFYPGPFPIKITGDYINNCSSDAGTDKYGYSAGITFGKAGKRKTWEIGYTYKWLGADAWWEELVDSDFGAYYAGTLANSGSGAGYGSGTNVKGHVFRAAYSPADSLTLGVKWFLTDLINEVPDTSESGMNRVQVDAQWKF